MTNKRDLLLWSCFDPLPQFLCPRVDSLCICSELANMLVPPVLQVVEVYAVAKLCTQDFDR